ncbi:nucleoside hydrolase [Harryflintia acetispora]|uniref:nucleoside hydrolase n=1 Tax=Harryflintia acetispora TaxID=1849041 RepID=UPI001A9BF466|nr:nucleoside hydrolase [Harryflintia acetispora]
MTDAFLVSRLVPPAGRVSAVMDTDTYNEVDDQFALAYALLSEERVDLKAIYAAPFLNERSSCAADGMEKSLHEIENVLKLMGRTDDIPCFEGSRSFMLDPKTPVESPAAQDLVERALAQTGEDPLYVIAIGAPTNIASALLLEPKIAEHIVVLWLGGHALEYENTEEFNLFQDIHASRTLLDMEVPLVLFPCEGVASRLCTTVPELRFYLEGRNQLGSYLCDIVEHYEENAYGWSKVIWDVITVAWLVNADWVPTALMSSPILTDQFTWSFDPRRHLIRVARFVERDAVFADLFHKISGMTSGKGRAQG